MNPFLYYRVCSLLSRIMIILLISIKSSFLLSPSLVSFSLILLYSWKKFCVKTACKIGIGCKALIVNGRLKHVNGRDYLSLLSDKQRNLIVLCKTTVTGHFWPFFLSVFVFFCLHIWLPLQLLQETETTVCRDLWVSWGKSPKSSLGNINKVDFSLCWETISGDQFQVQQSLGEEDEKRWLGFGEESSFLRLPFQIRSSCFLMISSVPEMNIFYHLSVDSLESLKWPAQSLFEYWDSKMKANNFPFSVQYCMFFSFMLTLDTSACKMITSSYFLVSTVLRHYSDCYSYTRVCG